MTRVNFRFLALVLTIFVAAAVRNDAAGPVATETPVSDGKSGLIAGVVQAFSEDATMHCGMGEVMSVLHAFMPGIFAVNEFDIGEDGLFFWIEEKPAGLGGGVARCQYRTAASNVPFLPDTWVFSEHDHILGGNNRSLRYMDPGVQANLDALFPDVRGSYRQKAIAQLARFREEVTLMRLTYFDEDGVERPVGDGGKGDPGATDPSLQDMMVTAPRDFFIGNPTGAEIGNQGDKVVAQQWAFITQLQAGTYHSVLRVYFDGHLVNELPPVELVILPCESVH